MQAEMVTFLFWDGSLETLLENTHCMPSGDTLGS